MKVRPIQDDVGRWVEVPQVPQRIVSLCPSQTETLYALGLRGRIVGRTRYCIHPKGLVEKVAVVGGTKKVEFTVLKALDPDLIIAQEEENTQEIVEKASVVAPVYVTRVRTVSQAIENVYKLGDLTDRREAGAFLAQEITHAWAALPQFPPNTSVLYFIWRKPYMVAGGDTYIGDVLRRLGTTNVAASIEGRYPQLSEAQIAQLAPALIFLSDEPFPFREKHKEEVGRLVPSAQIFLVRGEFFSWYGARMLLAPAYFQEVVS
ncbi:MAG: helical backbone metal receptor [Bacteroidia bacterium]